MSVLLGVRLSAACECLCSACVHQVAVTSFAFSKFCLEPSEQQPLPDFASMEAAMVWRWGSSLERQEYFGSQGVRGCWHLLMAIAGLSVLFTAAMLSQGAPGILC